MAINNPLFDHSGKDSGKKNEEPSGYVLPSSGKKKLEPSEDMKSRNAAVNVIRDKLATIYSAEPGVKKELEELAVADKPLSKHQKALSDIQSQAQSVAEIQTKWHEYYLDLPEHEKQEVWQEFYAEQARHSRYAQFMARPESSDEKTNEHKAVVSHHKEPSTSSASRKRLRDSRSSREVKDSLKRKLAASNDRQQPSLLHSLGFGLATGGIVLFILLFGLFNQFLIAPFIQPSRNVSATPIILDGSSIAADGSSKIIIPKINMEIPVDYTAPSMKEEDIQKALENGVVHYPSTVRPGEQGNVSLFGHSSNNIFNPGKYKFAFVLLSKLEEGDMFYLTYNKQVYAYKVFTKKIVNPNELWVLTGTEGKASTANLIACDPPGTTLRRLVVWGEQVSPDPAGNTAATTNPAAKSDALTGNAPSLWKRVLGLD